jgi:hypothetical protein
MIKNENRKEKTVVLLIDFVGAPVLGDEYVNNRRYSELQRLSLSHKIDKEKLIIVTNTKKGNDPKLDAILTMCTDHYGFKVIQLNNIKEAKSMTITYIDSIVYKSIGWYLRPSDTQIIVGGCELGGCVINAKPISAVHWAKMGFQTIIHLPLCAEYEQPGINSTEKAYNGFKQVYDHIQFNKAFNIQLTDKFEQLNFSFDTYDEE